MNRLPAFGFSEIEDSIKTELSQLNSKLVPLMMRYQGMGWYDILVQHEKGYAVVSIGGENGYTAEANEKAYIAIDDHNFKSIDDLLESISQGPWHEIVSEEQFEHGKMQSVKTVYPAGSRREDDQIGEWKDDSVDDYPQDLWEDFVDPIREY